MSKSQREKGKRETWMPVVGYEGLYEASNLGRVKSLPRNNMKHEHILKIYTNPANGYQYVGLSKNGKSKSVRVHKIVMEAFTDYRGNGYDKKHTIDHINGNKADNRLCNLEVCSQSENQNRAYKLGLQVPKGVEVINLDTLEIFASYTDASRSINGGQGEMVARVCRGERSHYRNHHFAHYKDYLEGTIPEFKGLRKKKASESLWGVSQREKVAKGN